MLDIMIDDLNNLSNCNKDKIRENTFNKIKKSFIHDSQATKVQKTDEEEVDDKEMREQINFINFTQQYCIGFIDIINSTQETAKITDPKKLRKYYSLFLNSMSAILHQYNGKIVKNSGDNLFFYFPKTSSLENKHALQEVFDCINSMIKSNTALNSELLQDGLPSINYRISIDYGMVEVALGANNKEVDLFGSVVNECAKINSLARCNGLSIGKGLHKVLVELGFIKEFEVKENKISLNKTSSDNLLSFYTVLDKRMEETQNERLDSGSNQSFANSAGHPTTEHSLNRSYKILLIDDDEDILYTYRSLLRKEKYSVEAYSSPIEALKHITEKKSHDYDLVVMDIRMPEVSGIKLFYMLKAVDPYMKILFVTALDLVGEFVEALPEIKMSEIMRKPLSEQQFITQIKKKLAQNGN
ncbi:MAG TPA: response regulator [Candidatus Saccharimonadales bacterium]|nr:response regulator [Candidatus Saccharimonadales bacterium]